MSKAFLPTILEQKEKEVAQLVMEDLQPLRQTYRLYDFLKSNQNKLQIISEVKKASPSMGDINLDVDIVAQAKTYEENGAAMISVLTDEVFFKGDISYLKEISSQVAIPTLAKDFIIDEKQIVRSRNVGATVILLIVAALPEARLKELYDFATSLGLEVLVETHNLPELEVAHRIGAEIIGVNNRNLVTFETDINTSLELSTHFKDKPVYISESAIFTGQDAALVAPYFNGILVGPVVTKSKRQVSLEQAHQLAKGVTAQTKVVGVFVSPSLEELEEAIGQVPLDIVQIHGSFDEVLIPKISVPVIRAIQISDSDSQVKSQADYLLFDAPIAGSGQTFDWQLLADKQIEQDYFIAGGLTVDNVAEVKEIFHPYALDVSSGVETDGSKDLDKIKAFIERVKA